MERCLGGLRILPGRETELDARIASAPHDLGAALARAGLRDVTMFRLGTDAWLYAQATPDRATALAMLAADPDYAAWLAGMRDVLTDAAAPEPLTWFEQVFHTDGAPLAGPAERGLFSLVIDPRRSSEYDDLHAHPWEEMIDAIHAAGYRDYSGFRHGANVVYVGRYHPDMATVLARIAETEVAERWGRALEGVIVAITDAEGRHFIGCEIFHQD